MVWNGLQQDRHPQGVAGLTSSGGNNMTRIAWQIPPDDLRLERHRADVWRVFLDVRSEPLQQMESALSADELQRASRFHFEKDRHRYLLAHASLRDILARYLQCEPRVLIFSASEYGKPFLAGRDVQFNLSHSGDIALIAVTRGRRIGVDVEQIRADVEIEKLASRYFSPREVSELMVLHPEEQIIGFYNCWTRKEAYIKAQGMGLSLPLDSFDVSLAPGEPAILRATRPDTSEAARWSLHSFAIEPNYIAALAVEGDGLEIRFWDWNVNH
jgi:4'-phosphopantetheinyl transferase